MTVQRWLAVALAGVLILGGCSAGRGPEKTAAQGDNTPAPSVSVSLPPNPYLTPIQNNNVKVNVPPPPKPTASGCPTPETNPLRGKSVPTEGSWIIAAVDPDERWEKQTGKCPYLFYGADCWIPFEGAWKLLETPNGSIVFQIFENGASTPLLSTELGPVPNAGRFAERTTGVPYKPSRTARSVTFRLLLKDGVGRVVAASDPETLPVPGCKPPTYG